MLDRPINPNNHKKKVSMSLSSASPAGVLIVGTGQAGAEVASALRQGGYDAPITLLGQEPHAPYRRPPLSKDYLAGKAGRDQLYVKPAEFYERQRIELRTGHRAIALDRERQQVRLETGETLAYQNLVLATGGRPRRLQVPGSEADNLHYIRTLDDIDRLRGDFRAGAHLLVVGGGYIGLETAAVAIEHGLRVTLLESAGRLLERVAAPQLSAFYQQLHEQRGVRVLTGAQLLGFEGGRRIQIARTSAGDLAVDLVVAGIGLQANLELARDAGLEVSDAIHTDAHARTSDPRILAIGDCASFPSVHYQRRLRLESVQNAQEQARTAAATLLGEHKPYDPVPWFWSDQYGHKLQMVGLSQGYQQTVVRGDMASGAFTLFYLRDGQIVSLDSIDRPQDFMLGKRLVAARCPVSAEQLADLQVPLKALLPA
jgi:3-phenylpropionate/trans-cinnamate dioxygenase ferredoxin reductase subunit